LYLALPNNSSCLKEVVVSHPHGMSVDDRHEERITKPNKETSVDSTVCRTNRYASLYQSGRLG